MKNAPVTFAVLLLLSCQDIDLGPTTSCIPTVPPAHPKSMVYQNILDTFSAKGLPGISILIRDDAGTWWGSSGKADILENIDMNTCTVSKAASITKTFVAALTMMLAEEGFFDLDDPLEKWLPEQVLNKVANIRACTIRQLMNHTTGIPDLIDNDDFYLGVLNDPDRKWKPEELIPYVYGVAPIFQPSENVSYSNTNYLLLAMVINKATGKNHAYLLRERVILPLNLGNTFYYWHDNMQTVAQGYFDLFNNGSILNVTNYNTGSGNGYGGLYSNVFDLQTFIETLVRERALLSEASLGQMLTFTKEESGANRANGLGIFKDFLERPADQFAYGHRGRDLGYTADMFWFPNQDYTLTYLINYGTDANSSLRPVFFEFRTAIVDAIMEN
ncbi:serine hydrolase domain-containing protein [Cyclobacterium jeungdonense]|uniref:Serine hydrolase domain-containing protein n=1 Tax=Cyclobacterium jeungdonense TaxID=708087 RepID=A0ABT8CD93_9BACT|nr:serine hydrolase domain-containing protein [Cyclobacterium jeungdonense]MDN3689518.1 serine hydrolase domain-containing protein [Cyclobacterium jeungdonense]